jgi:hypothetical protein
MTDLHITSVGFIDLALSLIVLEAIALSGWRAATGRGIPIAMTLPNLAAGAALLLAARAIATGAALPWAGLLLAAGLGAHLLDLWLRWRGASAA